MNKLLDFVLDSVWIESLYNYKDAQTQTCEIESIHFVQTLAYNIVVPAKNCFSFMFSFSKLVVIFEVVSSIKEQIPAT